MSAPLAADGFNETAVNQALRQNETAPNYWDPSDSTYIKDTSVRGIAVAIFGFLLLIAFLIFFIVRLICCCCCGKGMCARNKKPATTKTVIFNVILCAIPILLTFIGGGILAWKGRPVGDSLGDLVDQGIAQVNYTRTDLFNITQAVRSAIPPGQDIDISPLQDAYNQVNTTYTDLLDQKDNVDSYLNIVEIVIFVLGAAAFAVGLWGILTLLVRRSPFMTVFMIAAAIVGPCLWVLGGVGLVTHRFADDACNMMQLQLQGQLNPWVLDLARCQELANADDALNPLALSANAAVRDANANITQANQLLQTAVSLSLLPATAATSIPTLCTPFEKVSGGWLANENTQGCTELSRPAINTSYSEYVCQADVPPNAGLDNPAYQTCISNTQPLKQSDYQQLLSAADSYQAIAPALPRVRQLTQCGFVDRAFAAMVDENCPQIKRDLRNMMVAAIISAIGIALASLYFCVCFRNIRHRRYRPGSKEDPDADVYKHDNGKDGHVRSYGDSAHAHNGV